MQQEISLERLKLKDTTRGYGVSQEWYATRWQQQAGCGPSVATNLILFLDNQPKTKQQAIDLMHKVWDYITPSFGGVNTTKKFYGGLSNYGTDNDRDWNYEFCDVKMNKNDRPSLNVIKDFIIKGLNKSPVAWLNLDSGKARQIDSWHWMTIYGIYEDINQQTIIKILDNGNCIECDLSIWYNSTKIGGGFVYFY